MAVAIKHNGTTVAVEMLPNKKLPALTVRFDGENCVYKVASFDSEKQARWFCEVMEEFFKDLAEEDAE